MVRDAKRYCGIQPFFFIPHSPVTFSAKTVDFTGVLRLCSPSRGVAQPGSESDEIIEKSMPYAKVK